MRAAAELYNVLSSHGEPKAKDPGFETRLLINLKYNTERLSWSEDWKFTGLNPFRQIWKNAGLGLSGEIDDEPFLVCQISLRQFPPNRI